MRLPSEQRRPQIVRATLALLGTTSVERISTRQIAKAVGISQPALFRHFASRDEILEAVVDQTREDLEPLVQAAIAAGGLAGVEVLARGLFEHVERHPGLTRLLFHDLAGGGGSFHPRLVQLVSMQQNLVAELVRGAQAAGDADGAVDPVAAGRMLVALVQGVLLQARLTDSGGEALTAEAAELVRFWRAGLQAGEPRAASGDRSRSEPPAELLPALSALDVRPILAGGEDPLEVILGTLGRLPRDGLLLLTAPFRPAPLLALLGGKGYRVSAREAAAGVWVVEVLGPDAPEPVDLRDLPAPEPLEQVLLAAAALGPGEGYLARVPRVPLPLLGRLDERGLTRIVHEEPDRSAILHVRASDAATKGPG